MMAIRRSLAAFLNFSCALPAMYCTDGDAEEAAVRLRPERVLEVAVRQNGASRDRRRDPEELLLLVDLLGERHRVGARVHAGQDVDLLDVEEPLGLVDRRLGLRLAVAVDLDDLVLAEHATLSLIRSIIILAPRQQIERAGRRERAGVVVEQADLDRLALRGSRAAASEARRRRSAISART